MHRWKSIQGGRRIGSEQTCRRRNPGTHREAVWLPQRMCVSERTVGEVSRGRARLQWYLVTRKRSLDFRNAG